MKCFAPVHSDVPIEAIEDNSFVNKRYVDFALSDAQEAASIQVLPTQIVQRINPEGKVYYECVFLLSDLVALPKPITIEENAFLILNGLRYSFDQYDIRVYQAVKRDKYEDYFVVDTAQLGIDLKPTDVAYLELQTFPSYKKRVVEWPGNNNYSTLNPNEITYNYTLEPGDPMALMRYYLYKPIEANITIHYIGTVGNIFNVSHISPIAPASNPHHASWNTRYATKPAFDDHTKGGIHFTAHESFYLWWYLECVSFTDAIDIYYRDNNGILSSSSDGDFKARVKSPTSYFNTDSVAFWNTWRTKPAPSIIDLAKPLPLPAGEYYMTLPPEDTGIGGTFRFWTIYFARAFYDIVPFTSWPAPLFP
jgi:hypothetical protein